MFVFIPTVPSPIKQTSDIDFLTSLFEKNNVLVFGCKGKGKDLLFQSVINEQGKPYYGTQYYGGVYNRVKLSEMKPGVNTFDNFLEERTVKYYDNFIPETDFYLSDAGVYLPSWNYKELDKRYPGLPLYYAISRHLGQHSVHINSQTLNGVWNKLRDQAESFVKALGVEDYGDYLCVNFRYYQAYEAADSGLQPSDDVKFIEAHGIVKDGKVFISKSDIKYDTYYFASKLLYNGNNLNFNYKIKEYQKCLKKAAEERR